MTPVDERPGLSRWTPCTALVPCRIRSPPPPNRFDAVTRTFVLNSTGAYHAGAMQSPLRDARGSSRDAEWMRRVSRQRRPVGSPALVRVVWPRRLLRSVAGKACDEAL